MKGTGLLILLFSLLVHARAQKGCTDPQASNYDAQAKQNDGSCQYATTSLIPQPVCPALNDTLSESSGLIYYNNWFWTHNDSNNPPYIYAFDSITGKIIHRTFIGNKTNTDWEDMTQDSLNIYIGDFGNNGGNRTDLKILVIKKSDLKLKRASDTVQASQINFSFSDQVSFSNSNQAHDFDMEAFCFLGDSLHLFSKNWVDKKTRHYVLSRTPGTYVIKPQELFTVNGQVTGACADPRRKIIILTGYSKSDASCFAWILWDLKKYKFSEGNKRRIDLGSVISFGQNEGICFKGGQVYLSNEKYLTLAGLRRIETEQFITTKNTSVKEVVADKAKFTARQLQGSLVIKAEKETIGKTLNMYTSDGKLVKSIVLDKAETSMDIDGLMDGVYILKVGGTAVKVYLRK